MKESSILKQIEEYKKALQISKEFGDLVSIETLSELTQKGSKIIKDILSKQHIEPIGRFGKSYMYSKQQVLDMIKEHKDVKIHLRGSHLKRK